MVKLYAYSIKPVIGALSRAEGHCIAACCPVLLLYCRLTRCTVPGGFSVHIQFSRCKFQYDKALTILLQYRIMGTNTV
nr:MAG TPA: hypothetical protein [Caudoviricetes sp.]